jgi:NAD(P)-dependent dehydrogenase (short-subunit alcohol dehydrogenase family)
MSLRGKRALITGSSRGIGRGIALKLAAEGVKVAINYRENADAANDTLAQVRASGSDGFVIQADVSRPDDIRRMFANIRSTWGRKLATLYRPRNLEGGNGLADALLRGGAGSTAYHGE